jgi:D-arabinose 1-dehydrogenase-like Zn-dependent alcohol dehydrogenase
LGSSTIQIGLLMGYTIHATAIQRHHEEVRKLGARKVFVCKDANVVADIMKAAKEDGMIRLVGCSYVSIY